MSTEFSLSHRLSVFSDRHFKYLMVAPGIFILLLIGVFPLVYSFIVSFQNLTMSDADTSFQGLLNYRQLFKDSRLWWALAHTACQDAPVDLDSPVPSLKYARRHTNKLNTK